MVKVTFTFDEATVETMRRAAARLRKPNSVFVREAIQDYARRSEGLSDDERRHMLKLLDRMTARPPTRVTASVNAEIRKVRSARKSGGRKTRPE